MILHVWFALLLWIAGCGGEKPVSQTIESPAKQTANPEAVVTGSASIKGSIFYSGAVPEAAALSTAADPVCSKAQLFSEELTINENKTVQNAFVYVKKGLEGKSFPVPSASAVLNQSSCHYVPHVFGIQAGQTLEIVNSDPTLHNVHGMPELSKEFNVGMPLQGMKVKKTFDQSEVMVRFKCDVHPWMSAYAGVLPHPFFAVTAGDGTFELKGLSPGTYTLAVWHEKLGVQEKEITLSDAQETVDFTYS